MGKTAKYLLLSEAKVRSESLDDAIKQWSKSEESEKSEDVALYSNGSSILEISGFDVIASLIHSIISQKKIDFKNTIKNEMLSDWKEQVLILKDTVKGSAKIIPDSLYLQLRHIEVPLCVYDEYLNWRKETIFEYVLKNDKVDAFIAYHSLISTEPGVMFLSGFSCDKNQYKDSFNTPEYQVIVRQAGNKYISGGENGLYTKIYKKIY